MSAGLMSVGQMTASAPLTLGQARRIALAAQGLHRGKPAASGGASTRALIKTFDTLQLVQIDSVNVLSRSHYLPFFARLGSYDRSALDRLASRHPRKMVEYWAHEASFIHPGHFTAVQQWQRRSWFGRNPLDRTSEEALAADVLAALSAGRAMTARQVSDRIGHEAEVDRSGWGWNWHPVKQILEKLFIAGTVGVAGRTEQFERLYTPVERVIHPAPHSLQVASFDDAERQQALDMLIEASARAHGIGTARCFADYFRLPVRSAAQAVDRLVGDGVLEPVVVRGWDARLYLHREAARPRFSRARALLSPFDSVVFERRRLADLFGMHYRIGIYTPAGQRTHGYYVLPFLLGEQMVARVDLKADRTHGRLIVRTAFREPEAPVDTAIELAAELRLMADWLGLNDVLVEQVGDLAPDLARAVVAAG
ncbi:winged helix-turn-helix domain-containing protein [Psychromicrobium xiongbiense]|uniref:winged helix-turn-helix domain-containing protein n=1 Tax=Psychromicrobium xiongbiense TaxID=3051184 RepID=UPI0025576159|nr:crosslink repair DNA glycosylase YcaQ family protein [Psychromicrobium sp. YIM S02556]